MENPKGFDECEDLYLRTGRLTYAAASLRAVMVESALSIGDPWESWVSDRFLRGEHLNDEKFAP